MNRTLAFIAFIFSSFTTFITAGELSQAEKDKKLFDCIASREIGLQDDQPFSKKEKDRIKKLIADGATIDGHTFNDATLLLHLCENAHNKFHAIKQAVMCGANVNQKDSKGKTPFLHMLNHLTSESYWDKKNENNIDVIKLLLHNEADPYAISNNGFSIFTFYFNVREPRNITWIHAQVDGTDPRILLDDLWNEMYKDYRGFITFMRRIYDEEKRSFVPSLNPITIDAPNLPRLPTKVLSLIFSYTCPILPPSAAFKYTKINNRKRVLEAELNKFLSTYENTNEPVLKKKKVS